ncbi:MAG: PDZ domain-containing protein [Herpetosiphon sp.]
MATVQYTLGLDGRVQHLVDVQIEIEGIVGESIDLVLPAWTPGSYLMREYARQLQQFGAEADGRPTTWSKQDKGRWRVATPGQSLKVRYRVYGYELGVQSNHIDDSHAHLMPAATCMFVDGCTQQELLITVQAPDDWTIATGLDVAGGSDGWPGPGPQTFVAQDYDHLVDSPFEVGRHRSLQFTVANRPHRIVVWGRGNDDEHRLVGDAQRIVEVQRNFWGELPYQHYTFILLLAGSDARGGLEHRNSTSLLLPRFVFRPARSYERYLGLVSHEFFHTWNVKRLRAAGLGPFDYTRETYTMLLWAMEGVTVYYTNLLLVRAGLMTPERYLERLADEVVKLQETPGRRLQSLQAASFDTWVKFYRPDEHTPNSAISYYLKGGLVGLVLDLDIRRRSNNQWSLDDIERALWAAYPADGPGMPVDAYQRAISAHTGLSADEFFSKYVEGTEELPFEEAFACAGITMEWGRQAPHRDTGEPRPWLGIKTKGERGRLIIANVLSDGPGSDAGLSAHDEVVALDGFRVADETDLDERLDDYVVGDVVDITLFRREELITVPVALRTQNPDRLTLRLIADASPAQLAVRSSWLGSK